MNIAVSPENGHTGTLPRSEHFKRLWNRATPTPGHLFLSVPSERALRPCGWFSHLGVFICLGFSQFHQWVHRVARGVSCE